MLVKIQAVTSSKTSLAVDVGLSSQTRMEKRGFEKLEK